MDDFFLLLLEKALNCLYIKDKELIIRGLQEESINHRLAIYLEQILRKDLEIIEPFHVDLEYQKNGIDLKEVNGKNIRPDILVHRRNSNDHNFLAIESKLRKLSPSDIEKLKGLKKPPFDYTYSIGIEYGLKNVTKYFQKKYIKNEQFEKIELKPQIYFYERDHLLSIYDFNLENNVLIKNEYTPPSEFWRKN